MMSIPRTTGWGIALATATALISGVSVFLNGLVVKEFPDPVVLAGARNGLVGLVLVLAVVATGGVASMRTVPARHRWPLLGIALIGGSVPFILFFSGLAAAGGPGAALIHKTMFVWVAMLAVPLLGERLGLAQVLAMGMLLAGTLLIGPVTGLGTGGAELLILAATVLWAVEVVLVRWLLTSTAVSVGLAAAARMAIGAVGILGFLVLSGRADGLFALTAWQWLVIAGTGALLLGYVTTWYAALERAPASLVSSILVGGAVLTATLTVIRTGTLPAADAATGLGLLAVGLVATIVAGRRAGDRPADVRGVGSLAAG
jgi:drug/metabolite transporter (DMT)-like permease